ncbi:sodium-coupled neutral amino acid transporter 7-like [Oratosquilla oratoria]|uniref:sodium-coupled neutral amino acid transporter 7-like n=1 Tax=Oratosquilla oratoria TaxID=337810 RepID=UPI003F75C3A3
MMQEEGNVDNYDGVVVGVIASVASRKKRRARSKYARFGEREDGTTPPNSYSPGTSASSRTSRSSHLHQHTDSMGHIGVEQPHIDGYSEDRLIRSPRGLIRQDSPVLIIENSGIDSCEVSETSYTPGIGWGKAMFLIVNAALGGGLLNFPRAFHESGGIVSGNLLHIIFVVFALGSLIILAKCASQRGCKTYQEVVLQMCNPTWHTITALCITLYCFVTCVTFIIIIGDQFDRAFASYMGSDFCHMWYMNRKFTMMASSLLLIFPCCFKRIDGMQSMSYVGVLAIWYLTAVIITEFYIGNYERGPVDIWDLKFSKMFDVVPTICFGYQCHVSSIPIYSCLKKKDAGTFFKACLSAIIVCLLVYTFSANYGYLTFGSEVNVDVLLSYNAKKPHVLIAIILLAIKSWATYPILLFCVREAIGDMYIQWRGYTPVEAIPGEPTRRKLIAVILWISSIVLAVFTPNINIVVKLLGSLAAVFIFVFPGMCLIQMVLQLSDVIGGVRGFKSVGLLMIGLLYIVMGIFTFGLAFSLGIENILHPPKEVPLCV